ncbi:MAG: metallophosphoesterase [Clostridia bacterium]|nr:metallophosphoesterase [Clostridia bacterium]
MAPLKFTFLTDVHYYSPLLGTEGKAYERENSKSQKLLKDSGIAIASAFNAISQDKSNDIVLINGDLTNNGEMESHQGIIEMLRALKMTGKRVFVTTATHDFQGDGKAWRFEGDEKIETRAALREELFEMYREFGPDQAMSVHEDSMSYAVELEEGYILLALNDDRNHKGQSGFSDDLFEWITNQINLAKENGQTVVAMTHHPLIAPSELYAAIGKNDMMGEHETRLRQLADMGIGFVFTGHSHIHNISYESYENGKVIFDISTASLAGYPAYYRVVTIDSEKNEMDIRSVKTAGFDERFADQFFGMIRRVINAAADDIDDFAQKAEAFSVRSKFTYRYGWMIKPFAKLIRKIKVGTVCKICKKESGLTRDEIETIKDVKVMDLVINMAMNLYKGDGEYTPSTPLYKAAMGFVSVVDSLLNTIHLPISKFLKGVDSLGDAIEPLLYKKGIPDADAVIPVLTNADYVKTFETETQKITSKKGVGILILLILVAIILLPFLPLIAIILGICALANYIKYHKKIKEFS